MAITDKLSAIGNAIREKTGGAELLMLDQMPSAIRSIDGGGGGGGGTSTSLWADGSWSEITDVLNKYYSGEVSDLKDYFSVGDKRKITISAIEAASPLTDTHAEMTTDLVIIGIEHDDLATPISDTRTKAALTVQIYDLMETKSVIDSFSSSYSVSTSAPYAIYSNTERRKWLNSTFKNALPADMSALIKPVTKLSARGVYDTRYTSSSYKNINTSVEECFLLSFSEGLSGYATDYFKGEDGTQYEYYTDKHNFVKWSESEKYPTLWWSRTGLIFQTSSQGSIPVRYYAFSGSGYGMTECNTKFRLCPAWCL